MDNGWCGTFSSMTMWEACGGGGGDPLMIACWHWRGKRIYRWLSRNSRLWGLDGLAEEDKYLMEISLGDLETTSGEYQAYWLLAVKAARNAYSLRRQQAQAAARRSRNNHG